MLVDALILASARWDRIGGMARPAAYVRRIVVTRVPQPSDDKIEVTTTSSGVDSFALDTAAGTWRAQPWSPDPPGPLSPLPIGQRIFTPPQEAFLGTGNPGVGQTALVRNPATGTVTDVPHGPIDDLGAEYLWTGSSVLGFNTGTYSTGPGGEHLPGAAAALDPATGKWRALPPAPLTAQQEAAVWTGTELLMWGQMYDVKSARGNAPAQVAAAGLAFGR